VTWNAAPGVERFARLPHILRALDIAIEREGGRVDVLPPRTPPGCSCSEAICLPDPAIIC
jgi:hypothetical protein